MPRSRASTFTRPVNFPISPLIFLTTFFSTLHSSLSLTTKSNFGPNLVLLGDAKFTNNLTSVQITDPTLSSPSSGFLILTKPISFVTANSKIRKPVSFSTDFTFSISSHDGDGLAFLIFRRCAMSRFTRNGFGVLNQRRFFAVEFDTSVDENLGDLNANHVGVDVGSLVSVSTSNVSSIGLVLNSGIKLHCWIDYDSSSKRIEVRLSKSGSARPYIPLLVYQIDLGEMWKNEEVFVGLGSTSGNSMQTSYVYSWQFKTRTVPKSLHSQPLDPLAISEKQKLAQKKRVCALGLLSGLVFLTGCAALLALIVLLLLASFENRSETILTIPAKCTVHSEGFKYEKINVVAVDELDGGKK